MTGLRIATLDDLDRVLPMVRAFHLAEGLELDDAHRQAALTPLLEGIPHGVLYLIGPQRAPVGYIVITFGWSLELGGLDGFVDEFWIRDAVRGRGIGAEVLAGLMRELARHGMKALHLEAGAENSRAQALYGRMGFKRRDGYHLMTAHIGNLANT